MRSPLIRSITRGLLGKTVGDAISNALNGSPLPLQVTETSFPVVAPEAPAENTVYGSARLIHEVGQSLTPAIAPLSTSIVMGSDELNGDAGYIWDLAKSPAHAMTFGPTRKGGKGTSAIIPALITYTAGSTITVDPKLENAWVTADRLRQQGKRVVIMDPWNEVNRRYGSKVGVDEPLTKFNPMYGLDPASDDFADDVAALADALVVVPDTQNRHFDESARELLAGLIAAVVIIAPDGTASLRQVRELLSKSELVLIKAIEGIVKDYPDSLAAAKLARFSAANNEIRSIRSTALTQTAFLDSKTLLNAMETDEKPFDLAELATSRVALFLGLPVDRLNTHGRWMRLIITMAIRAIARQDSPPKAPVLFLLDEMGTIGRLSMVESAYGLMAGLGIRLWGFFQDLVQLQGLYPKTWETFISNSSVIQILKAHDATTSEYVTRFLGDSTVNAATGGASLKTLPFRHPDEYENLFFSKTMGFAVKYMPEETAAEIFRIIRAGKTKNASNFKVRQIVSFMGTAEDHLQKSGITQQGRTEWTPDTQLVGRPLLNPDEVRRIDDARCLLLIPGESPVMQFRTVYYKHPLFVGLYRSNPYFTKPAESVPEKELTPV